jgi:glycosyltransferase involved in cell wall biosynthesis
LNLRDARIGYASYSPDFSVPGDRRRFCAYAQLKAIPFTPADLRSSYDLVLVTHNADLPAWTARKRREGTALKLVFELVDTYFKRTGPLDRMLKGAARYALGIDSRLSPDFVRTLIRACECADAVICSTEEQRQTILKYNPDVFTSFDYFAGDLGAPKQDYGRSGKLRLVWEGQSTTLPNIQVVRDVLNDLRDRVELHVVTDPLIHRHFARFGAHPARDALKGIDCDIIFHPWQRETFSDHVTGADVALIPIDQSNAFARGKPENKLVMLWQLGMPVLASATPAYRRTMAAAGIDLTCASPAEWRDRLERLINADVPELERIGKQGRSFAEQAYSADEFVARFDAAFTSAGFEV